MMITCRDGRCKCGREYAVLRSYGDYQLYLGVKFYLNATLWVLASGEVILEKTNYDKSLPGWHHHFQSMQELSEASDEVGHIDITGWRRTDYPVEPGDKPEFGL
jgi:hypothetical protein